MGNNEFRIKVFNTNVIEEDKLIIILYFETALEAKIAYEVLKKSYQMPKIIIIERYDDCKNDWIREITYV